MTTRRICKTTVRISLLNMLLANNATQVMMMMMMIGARRARCHRTRYRRGGVRTLLVDALLLLMIVGCCKGALLENNANYEECLSSPANCTSLDLSSQSLSGTIPTQLGTLTALQILKCPPTSSNNNHIIAPHIISAPFSLLAHSCN